MELKRALRLAPSQVVAFTGAGGKTSALEVLVAELAPEIPLLLTTTTKFGQDQFPSIARRLIDKGEVGLDVLAKSLDEERLVLWTGPALASEAKWGGVDPTRIDAFKEYARQLGAIVLVEADGARGRSIKAPAEHEPVIPKASDLVVPLLGLSALGRPLDEIIAHRPDRVVDLTSIEPGEPLTPESLISLTSSTRGGLKGVPDEAEVRVVLNQVESVQTAEVENIAIGCLATKRIEAVVAANLKAKDPVERVIGRTAGVVLAAGGASRMGELKQVREWQGVPLVRRMVQAAIDAGLDPVVVVTGKESDRVAEAVASTGAELVHNPDWNSGQSGSMRLGLDKVAAGSEAVVFMLADMPLVEAEHIKSLVAAHQRRQAVVVAPRAEGRYGNPVLFDRMAFPALRLVEGDKGGRAVFDQFEIEELAAGRWALVDVDTEEDWDRLDG